MSRQDIILDLRGRNSTCYQSNSLQKQKDIDSDDEKHQFESDNWFHEYIY